MQGEINDAAWKNIQEIMFLSNAEATEHKAIMLIHALNIANGLKCNGLLEDDLVEDCIIPTNWQQHKENIYSFRYINTKNSKETLYFKIIHEPQADLLYINVVSSANPDSIISDEIKEISKLKPTEKNEITAKIIKNYQKNVLDPLLQPKKPTAERSNLLIKQENPQDFFWSRPRNNDPTPSYVPNFGDFGSSDLRPIPLGGINSGGSLLGPNNPIFSNNPNNNNNPFGNPGPNIRFDPFGPGNINGSFPTFDGGLPRNPKFGQGFGGGNGFF